MPEVETTTIQQEVVLSHQARCRRSANRGRRAKARRGRIASLAAPNTHQSLLPVLDRIARGDVPSHKAPTAQRQ
jgi:hypothetical protein